MCRVSEEANKPRGLQGSHLSCSAVCTLHEVVCVVSLQVFSKRFFVLDRTTHSINEYEKETDVKSVPMKGMPVYL